MTTKPNTTAGYPPLTQEEIKALAICTQSLKVSISEVQRKLGCSYADAQSVCQSLVDLGLVEGLTLAPSLHKRAYIDADRASRAQAAPQPEFLPLLVRDIANDLGASSAEVCKALKALGFGDASLNMAVTPAMAAKLREHFADQPAEAVPARDATRVAVSTAPERIWLDVGDDEALDCTFRDLDDVTWSDDNATGFGIEYVRADIAITPAPKETKNDH